MAPAYMRRALAGKVSCEDVWLFLMVICSQRPAPSTATTLEWNLTAMFFVAAIWFSRYCYMVSDKEPPRTTMVTWRANLEKYMAA